MKNLVVSSSPHITARTDTQRIIFTGFIRCF